MERTRQNIYWDCYTGLYSVLTRAQDKENDYSFEKIEQLYYFEHYADHIQAQNERNEKTRHTERNKTVNDLLTNNKTCPEESIYQIGTVDESVSGEVLAKIATELNVTTALTYPELFRLFAKYMDKRKSWFMRYCI